MWIHNGYQPQTSYVSENGQASALLTVIKSGASSTLTIVDQVKAALPKIKAGLPSALTLTPIFDQSVLVRASIRDVVQEAITAAFLTALMVLVFLGSWRSTLIVSVLIPLACLFAIAVSSALGATINVMSLGGLALAVGMLVDDATVEIENTHRNLGLEQKKPLASAILDSAEQVAVPALIATMSICIVFVPVTLLSGSAKYIFTPLALNVVLALVASYGLSRTLVPTMMHFLLPKEAPLYQGQEAESPLSRSFIWRFHQKFEHGFDRFAEKYKGGLEWALEHRAVTLAALLLSETVAHIPPEVLSKNTGLDKSVFAQTPGAPLYIFPGNLPHSLEQDKAEIGGAQVSSKYQYTFRLRSMEPTVINKAGEVRIVDSGNFPVSKKVAGALLIIKPGHMREIHWHPNAAEWQYWISGKGRMTVFFPVDNARTMDFNTNDVGFVPSNAPHYIENTGDTDLVVLELFAADEFMDVSLNQWLRRVPSEMLKAHLNIDKQTAMTIPAEKLELV